MSNVILRVKGMTCGHCTARSVYRPSCEHTTPHHTTPHHTHRAVAGAGVDVPISVTTAQLTPNSGVPISVTNALSSVAGAGAIVNVDLEVSTPTDLQGRRDTSPTLITPDSPDWACQSRGYRLRQRVSTCHRRSARRWSSICMGGRGSAQANSLIFPS